MRAVGKENDMNRRTCERTGKWKDVTIAVIAVSILMSAGLVAVILLALNSSKED